MKKKIFDYDYDLIYSINDYIIDFLIVDYMTLQIFYIHSNVSLKFFSFKFNYETNFFVQLKTSVFVEK